MLLAAVQQTLADAHPPQVFGVTDSVSKVTGSIGKGLAAATMDPEFQSRRRMTRFRNKPKHALYGITGGANAFFTRWASQRELESVRC